MPYYLSIFCFILTVFLFKLGLSGQVNLYDYTPLNISDFTLDSEKSKFIITETYSGKIKLSIWDEITGNRETISFGVDNLTQYIFDKGTYKCE